jgi:hypothetical protein
MLFVHQVISGITTRRCLDRATTAMEYVRMLRLAIPVIAIVLGAGTALAAPAETQHQVIRETAPFELENPCTGELITGIARFHFVESAVANSNVSHGTSNEYAQLRGETAAGVTYVGMLVAFLTGNGPLTPPPPTEVLVLGNPTFHMVRQGEDGTNDDFYAHVVLITHIDIESQTTTLAIEHVRTECQ